MGEICEATKWPQFSSYHSHRLDNQKRAFLLMLDIGKTRIPWTRVLPIRVQISSNTQENYFAVGMKPSIILYVAINWAPGDTAETKTGM